MLKKSLYSVFTVFILFFYLSGIKAFAIEQEESSQASEEIKTGGGYAVTQQSQGTGYAAKLYNSTNGLPTSDANCILATEDGYIWIGGYAGVIRYDGTTFERQNSQGGLTNANALYEDSQGRLWVGTNDNGIVVLNKDGTTIHYTYEDGLRSSTMKTITEGGDGNIYVGSTSGVVYIDADMQLHELEDSQLENAYIIRLVSDKNGLVYGNTRSGGAFILENGRVTAYYNGENLGTGAISNIFPDPNHEGYIYLGTDEEKLYYGSIDNDLKSLQSIDVPGANSISFIDYACNRLWVISDSLIGYLNEGNHYKVVENVPLNSNIAAMTEDYQGNLWFASTRQGVMKLVSNNYFDMTEAAGLSAEVVNATCKTGSYLYVGTDKGLQIINCNNNQAIDGKIIDYIGNSRIRAIAKDNEENVWIGTYTNGLGLIKYTPDKEIVVYNEDNGFISNGIRAIRIAEDGSVLVATNGGMAVFKDGRLVKVINDNIGISNTVFLTLEEGDDDKYYIGTDGDGVYIVDDTKVVKKGREDGLTSDVILRIKRDTIRDVYWIITSNSIEYMKDEVITNVDTFPYSNNYDVYYDEHDNVWVLASDGIYVVKAQDLIDNNVVDYVFYDTTSGLPSVPTGNAFSFYDEEGYLYIAGRAGVSKVNINNYFNQIGEIKTGVKSITCNEQEITADENGIYTIPPTSGRIQINASVLNYGMTNPILHIFLEGDRDPGITVTQDRLQALEYTALRYGDYLLHIQVLDSTNGNLIQDQTFKIVKKPLFHELLWVRVIAVTLGMLAVGFLVWWIMTGTIIRHQYEQIRLAKEDAERANTAKSRFLANVSHEIRTPINTIMGMDEMILREDATDVPKPYFLSIVNYAMDIRGASESLLGLINDILDLSKIESGKMHLVEQDYDMEQMLRSVISMIRVRSEQKDLAFETIIDKNLPKTLYGDAGKIKQVVLNLLTNAVKYTEMGGFTLKAALVEKNEDTCKLQFSVKDTGIGVKAEDIDKLFTAFERLDEERNSAIQGTGLGLNISSQFAQLMGGSLTCDSVYGEGSNFVFTVEQKIVDSEPIGEFKEHDDEVARGPYVPLFCAPKGKVLVVDDNPMNQSVIKGLLKPTKLQVTLASSGEECIELIQKEDFNLVLLDHMMPGMDGIETLQEIRKTHPELTVFALTANAATDGDKFYKSKGFDGYLSKPIDGAVLEKAIKEKLPEDILEDATPIFENSRSELPEDMHWLHRISSISVEDGIKASGGVDSYIFSLGLFLDTIEENSRVIENALKDNDIRLYTVKVHALKTSARIIGDNKLSSRAKRLEDAGNKNDMDYINANTARFLEDYRAYEEKLSRLKKVEEKETEKTLISEDELSGAFSALKELTEQMDYDGAEMVLSEVRTYRLPQDKEELVSELEKALKGFDWDKMEELLN